ncbi:myosin, partial [Gregarina niphandrodes]
MTFAALVRNKQAQSIVISGESGAGKTEATKILLRYFSELDHGRDGPGPGPGPGPGCIETYILNSNPILESFGNAKTLRNDNSSRFGRFIQLFFDVENQRRIKYARISHYLLEKCRLVSLYEKERNFHIFYQLVFGGVNHAHFKQKLEHWGLHEPRKFKAILGDERLYDLVEGMHSPQTAQSHNSGARLFSSQAADDAASLLQPWQSGSMWSNSSQDWTEANEWLESWGIMFDELLESMAGIGFTEFDVDEIFGVVAGIMHLSRVRFTSVDIPPQATYIDGMPLTKIEDYEPLEFACRLLQLKNIPSIIPADINDPVAATADVLLFKSIRNNQGQGYWIRTPRDPVHAAHTRDSIVKEIYSRLFDWIIKKINLRLTATPVASVGQTREAHNREVLAHGATHGLRESHSVYRQQRKSSAITTIRNSTPPIGLLDIYGFEVFDGRNSFEQLCINFANEKLQQHFNQHVLALEQATYRKEAIDWSDILFTDNREIIRALEEPPHGVFVILDDTRITDQRVEQPGRGGMERASSSGGEFRGGGNYHHHDMMFLREIDRRGLKPVVALPDRKQFRDTIFTVKHYAGVVDYCCLGFVEKNVDKLEAQSCYFLSKASRHALVRELFPHDQAEDMAVKRNSLKATLGVEFRNQLDRLLKSLTSTTPTYIRCIKPNGLKQAGLFNSHDVLRQLEYAGLLESIRIRNSGFGVRCTFQEFLDDYLITLPHEYQLWLKTGKHNQEKAKELCTKLLTLAAGQKSAARSDAEDSRRHWQIGRTKIFMREEVQVYLEQARSAKRLQSAIKIQAHVRAFRQRERWRRL